MRRPQGTGAGRERLEGPPVRVAQVVLSNAYAGTEHHVLLLAQWLQTYGGVVRVICGDRNLALRDAARAMGVMVYPLQLGRGNLPCDWRAAERAIVGWGPHVVHAHLGNSLLCGAVLASLQSRPLVFTQHFIRPAYRNAVGVRGVLRGAAHRVLHRRIRIAIASTRAVRDELVCDEGLAADRIAIVPPGIDVARVSAGAEGVDIRTELDLGSDAVLLVTPARLEREKDHATLLLAFVEVVKRFPRAHLLLAGGGSREPQLRTAVKRFGIENNVHFLGFRSDVPQLLRQGTVCVFPSVEESFGLVLLESMAVGTPVIACDIPGPQDIVIDGDTGLLVPPREPDAMAAAIIRVLGDQISADRMGAAGRRRVARHFTAQRMAKETMDVYRSALGL